MIISSRTREIIRIIAAEHGFITVHDIAEKMNVSERTVYREIPDVTRILKNRNIGLLSVSKKGLKIEADRETMDNFMEEIEETAKIQVFESEDRKNYIIFALLHEDDFIKTEALSIDLKISLPTIRNDLKKIEQQLENQDVKLIKKKGEGICLDGTQMAKDHLLINTVMKNVECDILINWLDGELAGPHPFLALVEKYGYRDILSRTHRSLRDVPFLFHNSDLYVDDWNYVEYIFLVTMMIVRHEKGKTHAFQRSWKENNPGDAESVIGKRIKNLIETEFGIVLDEEEEAYLSWVTHLTIHPDPRECLLMGEAGLKSQVNRIVGRMNEELGIHLEHDADLIDGLLVHLSRALKRVRSGMSISNPMIREIEKEYARLFEITGKIVREIFPEDKFTQDEIGYLTLYFAVSLDKFAKRSTRILIVCSSGMGSSKMLASRLEREISEIYVKKVVSLLGLGKEDLDRYDLILSTIPLYLEPERYIKVSPMLKPYELELIKEKIRRSKYETLCKIERTRHAMSLRNMDFQRALEEINYYTRMAVDLLNDFQVAMLSAESSKKEVLRRVADWAGQIGLGIALEDIETFFEKKKVNESYFVIPATNVGYFECYVKGIRKPAMIICCFDRLRQDDEQEDERTKSIIMLFYPYHTIRIERQLVGRITDMIIEDADVIRLIEEGDQVKIRQIMGFRLLENIKRLYIFDE